MMPLRRGKGSRPEPSEASEDARGKDAEEAIEEAAEEVSEETAEPAEPAAEDEKADERARARAAAKAERQAQKDAARADKEAKKRAVREAKADRKASRRRRREERRKRKERERAEERPKAKEKPEAKSATKAAAAPKAKPAPEARADPSAKDEGKAKPEAEKPKRTREKSEKPKAKPRRERAGAGVALKSAGSKVNAALTGPRAKHAAGRVDSGIQSAWKFVLAGLMTLLAGAFIMGRFVAGGLRELGALWIRAAEILGGAILWAYRRARPLVLAGLRGLRAALRVAERAVTPKRAVAFVVLAAAGALAASQFVDYRGVRIGAPEYAGVEAVAPAPQTDRATTGSVHGYAMVPVAAVIIVAALLALGGRWRMARIIPLLAALAIAVSLLLDARRGLDEGDAAIAYQGAQAVLIEGFWLQLAAASVLLVTGLLLGRYARSSVPARHRRPSGDGRDPSRRKRRFRTAGVRA
jgi:hypothetical protein